MTGTLLNVVTIVIGAQLGMTVGSRLPERVRQTVMAGLGLFTFAIGIQMFLQTNNPLIALGGLLIGGLLGEWWRIEDRLRGLGAWLEARFSSGGEEAGGNRFVRGFLAASLLFCVGPMSIIGSIQDGLLGDYQLLAIKSMMDGFAALALASTLGVGVMFSIVTVFVYQGGISLMAVQARSILTDPMTAELTAVGGILLMGLSIGSLLDLKPIRTGNLLPALAVSPLIVWILQWLGRS
ncbi:MAG TPA: DUF554 domain-containing protein [Anaerolineales bacterium]|nr:DUF554 domain-containing protein [Anaerolineales bacterium]